MSQLIECKSAYRLLSVREGRGGEAFGGREDSHLKIGSCVASIDVARDDLMEITYYVLCESVVRSSKLCVLSNCLGKEEVFPSQVCIN